MELQRRTNNKNSNLARANILRDWGPTLLKLGKTMYEYTQQEKGRVNAQNSVGSIAVGGTTPGRRTRRGKKKTAGAFADVPRGIPLNTVMHRVVKGSTIIQYASGSFTRTIQIGCASADALGELVSPGTMTGVDLYFMRCFGFIKFNRVSITFTPTVSVNNGGYVAMAVRSAVDTTPATPAYIRQVPGSVFSTVSKSTTLSFTPTAEHGILVRKVNLETAPSDDISTSYAGTVLLYSAIDNPTSNAVAGILSFTLDLTMWNS